MGNIINTSTYLYVGKIILLSDNKEHVVYMTYCNNHVECCKTLTHNLLDMYSGDNPNNEKQHIMESLSNKNNVTLGENNLCEQLVANIISYDNIRLAICIDNISKQQKTEILTDNIINISLDKLYNEIYDKIKSSELESYLDTITLEKLLLNKDISKILHVSDEITYVNLHLIYQ